MKEIVLQLSLLDWHVRITESVMIVSSWIDIVKLGYELLYVLHDTLGIPKKGVGVKIFCWVEPEVELLFSFPFPLCVNVCVHNIRISTQVPQELEINLITVWPF